MIGKTNSQVGGGIKGEKVNISLLTNQPEHSALMGAAITVKYGESETQYVWEGVGITVTIPPYEDYEVSVSGVEGYKTPEVFTATAQADNARSLNFEYKAERVKVTLSAVGGADMNGTTVTIYGQEYTFSGTPIEVLVPFDEVYSVQGGAFGSLVAPLAQSFTASIPLREINLDYRTCVLVVNMLSNQVSDATIAALKASVKYGSTTIEVANGVMVDIPSGTDITVTFPEVENYNTPSAITFTSVNGINTQSATYVTERVIVNASANDGSSVDGVTASVTRYKKNFNVPNGVYIQDINGRCWAEEEWDGSANPNGIVIVDGNAILVALRDAHNDSNNSKPNNGTLAKNFVFPDGTKGNWAPQSYWKKVVNNKDYIESALRKCGGETILRDTYWTSTTVNVDTGTGYVVCQMGGGGTFDNYSLRDYARHRAIVAISSYYYMSIDPEEKIITNGKAEFKVSHGTQYSVAMSDKQGYKTPAMQSFVADSVSRYVNMEYQFSGLKLNILSNQANDTALANVKALVTYGDTSVELGNGETLGLSASTEVTITFPDVPDYKTPEPITFTHTGGYSEKTGTYLTEKVTVNVSANDGASVEGQVVNITKKKTVSYTPANGVYIQDVDGFLYTESEWDGSNTPNGIAVVGSSCSFVIALSDISDKSLYDKNEAPSNMSTGSATTDFDGYGNTQKLMQSYGEDSTYAAGACYNHIFPNNQHGYLPSAGEMNIAIGMLDAINSSLLKAGGSAFRVVAAQGYITSTYSGIEKPDNYRQFVQFFSYDLYAKRFYANGVTSTYCVRAFTQLNAKIIQPSAPEDKEIVNGKVEFKAAHGTEYSVSVNDKTGYKTPASKSFTAQLNVNNVEMEYQKIVPTDLSKRDVHGNKIAQTTANCYVVSEAGDYMIPIAYGAAIKNGQVNAASFTNNGGANSHDFVNYKGVAITSPYVETDTGSVATSVQMSISDTENAVTNLGIINGDGCKYISFSVPSVPKTGANAVISVKDAEGVIMWNWHIWLWEDDLTPVEITNATPVAYNIMPVNLGSKWDEDAKTHIKNWFYQFGRPTPLLCPSAYNSTTNHASFGVLSFSTASIASDLSKGIKNPATFYKYSNGYYYNWFSTNSHKTYNLWDAGRTSIGSSDNDVKKTVYDPCPVGFKMPNGNTFTYFSNSNVVGSFVNGWKFKRYSGDTVGVFFPASGYRNLSTNNLVNVGSDGYVWLSSANSKDNAYYLHVGSSYVDPKGSFNRASGLSVRPVTDTGLEGQTKLTVTRIDQTITDPEGMITRIVDLGGIESVRANSHRYTGEVVDGVMQLKQISDVNGKVYTDTTPANLTSIYTDVWMKLPQFYWKCVQVKTDVFDFYVAYGAKPDDTYKTWDGKDLIGVYEACGSGYLFSISEHDRRTSEASTTMKQWARNRGEGFTLVKWKHHCMMAMLYYAQYGNTNCQAKIGHGTSYTLKQTGETDSLGMTDTVAGVNGESISINFWGLENWWGQYYEVIDNVSVNNLAWTITEDDGTTRVAGTANGGSAFISKMLFGENIDLIPIATSGSETTGYCDYASQGTANSLIVLRSHTTNSTRCGVAGIDSGVASGYSGSSCTTRLAYYGDYTIID